MLKKIFLPLVASGLFAAGPLFAEVRIGYVNTAKVVEMAPQAAVASSKLQAEFASREAGIVAQQKKFKALEDKRERDMAIMSEEARRKMERELLSLQRDIKRSQEEFNQDLNLRRNEEFAKLQKQVLQAIVNLAKDDKYDVILNDNSVLFASDKVDLTTTVIERLKQSSGTTDKK